MEIMHASVNVTFFLALASSSSSSSSNNFLFFLKKLGTSDRGLGRPLGLKRGGRRDGRSSVFSLGVSSLSLFLLMNEAPVDVWSPSSLPSRPAFCSLSREPGRLDAYLKPGPLFCLQAKEWQENTKGNFIPYECYTLFAKHVLVWYTSYVWRVAYLTLNVFQRLH